DLVAHVDHPDVAALGPHEDRRDVPAAQREQEAHALAAQDLGDLISTVHHVRSSSSGALAGASTCTGGTKQVRRPVSTTVSPARTSTSTRCFLPDRSATVASATSRCPTVTGAVRRSSAAPSTTVGSLTASIAA